MIELIKIELYKIFRKPRTFIGFIAVTIIVTSVHLGFYFDGNELLSYVMKNLKDKFMFEGQLINAYTVSYIILTTLWIHIPLLIALVTGDLISGETNAGTFRLLLTRPVSRTKLLTAKFISGWIYVVLLVSYLVVFSILFGWMLYGTGDMIVYQNSIIILSSDDVIWRFALALLYGIMTMTVVASLSFMLSAFSDNSVGPIIGALAIIIGITVISAGLIILKPVMPYLFTTYFPEWSLFFAFEIDYTKLYKAVIVEFSYIIVFLGVTYYYFNKKDILS